MERTVNLPRRKLLVALGLALPAVTGLATRANATTSTPSTHHPHSKKHGHGTQASSHKHHKPAASPATTQG